MGNGSSLRVGGRLALFCIHRVNQVYGALLVTSWTCYVCLVKIVISFIINQLFNQNTYSAVVSVLN